MSTVTSSSLYSLLSSYYSSSSADETSSSADESDETTESSSTSTLSEEDVISLSYSLQQNLVSLLSSVSGVSSSATTSDLSGLYEALSMEQNADALTDVLASYYSDSDEDTTASDSESSSVDTTA